MIGRVIKTMPRDIIIFNHQDRLQYWGFPLICHGNFSERLPPKRACQLFIESNWQTRPTIFYGLHKIVRYKHFILIKENQLEHSHSSIKGGAPLFISGFPIKRGACTCPVISSSFSLPKCCLFYQFLPNWCVVIL